VVRRLQLVEIEILVYNGLIGRRLGKICLGNYSEIVVLLLLLLHLALLAYASLRQLVYTMNSLPVSSVGWSLSGRPTMLPPSDLVRLEHSFASKNLRFKCRKKTAVQRLTLVDMATWD
jgi:hypothetical protein